ncbi:late embryogenesis abundant protein 47 [Cynara cardunculus var. scolymus]|uniref:late embryogenesis abundant protein 47 n=1 Tax=Cynara cardunculus var. scolymus TaxID=59895 RepID=UPI000D62EEAA|nr:late embryogenesis abundant protein 47 [Cynara cardunculus var. scolymus]
MSQERLMKPQESGEEASRQNQRKGDVSVSDKATESLSTKRNDDVQNCDDNELTISSQKCMAELKVGRKNSQQASPVVADAIFERGNITIGEALEATALTAGSRPVDYSDAAAIQAAEVRATGRTNIVPGGVAAAAQSAATRNARVTRDDDKTKLSEILAEATSKLPADKPVTRRDAEGVIGAELRNDPNLTTRPGGVAASLAAAARINQINLNPPNKE